MITSAELTEFRADVPPMSEQAYQDGLNRLRAEIKPGRRRWWYAAAAVAAAAACLLAGVIATRGHQPSSAAAAEILQDAATRATLKPTLHPQSGQWVYYRINVLDGGTPGTAEMWIPADAGTGRQTFRDSSLPKPSTVDRYVPGVSRLDFAPYDVLAALPTDPGAMIARIASDPCGRPDPSHGPDLAIWSCGRSLADLVPPAQESALFRGLARLPGVHSVGPVTMFDGRRGVALGMQDPNVGGDIQMVFAAGSHEFIGEQVVVPHQRQPEFNTSVVRIAIVDDALQRP